MSTPRSRFRRVLRLVMILGALVFVTIQFVPVEGVGKNPEQRYKIEAPPEVEAILRDSCFDCHSNETAWPFYARLAPSSWLLLRDVKKGRAHMNFSEWGDTDDEERNLDKENSWEQIEEGEMPPWFYLPMHPGARMTEKKKAILKKWLLANVEGAEGAKEAQEEKAAPVAATDGGAKVADPAAYRQTGPRDAGGD